MRQGERVERGVRAHDRVRSRARCLSVLVVLPLQLWSRNQLVHGSEDLIVHDPSAVRIVRTRAAMRIQSCAAGIVDTGAHTRLLSGTALWQPVWRSFSWKRTSVIPYSVHQ